MRKQKGFTLIELLVVIAIIGLLSTLAVVALNNARMKSRDARRISDIKQIQTALELYYNDNNGYPATVTSGGAIGTYMAVVPSSPPPSDCSTAPSVTTYTYAVVGSSPYTSYNLSYCLGGNTGGVTLGVHTATPSGIQ
ncbi:MAG: type II secretion system protein [Patescibacteria group bacterium]|nr:type II secretion system protein [Patescibacteria group bacterium]